jgi:hypothetical protein
MPLLALNAVAQPKAAAPAAADNLRRQFESPPDDARPMMRWWWFGPSVTHDELARELQTMKQGGIGGVEVQAVYPLALDDNATGIHNLPYLSDGFLDALRFASHTGRDLGMRVDLTLGSGWPYGGATVPLADAAGMLRVARVKVDASTRRVPLPSLSQDEHLIATFIGSSASGAANEAFVQARTTPEGTVDLPRGMSGEVVFFISSRTGQQVKRAAVGAEGFVVDHYDSGAVGRYLHSVADRLMQGFDQQPPYAVFCDSLEVYGSDWSDDFLQEFQKRRGYDLKPHLPALVADVGPETAAVRYDWIRTLGELFNERFAAPLHDWAKQNHTRLRMQSYGAPPANVSSYSQVDLPEGEGPQWKVLSATRWASSASHIYGVPITSSETWTWLHSPVFRATPLDMKAEADRHFLIGINQLVGHGWPYTPPGVAYPGWRFYAAAVLDEQNPWWIVMPDITQYLQRVSFLLRQGSPANDIALYLPTADAAAHMRAGHVELFPALRDQLGPDVIARILEAGYDFDVFDDDVLRTLGKIDGHSLQLGPNRYRVVILPAVERIPLESYRKLEEFVRAGGILIATKRLPEFAPGLRDAQATDIRTVSRNLFDTQPAPAHFVGDEAQLGTQLAALLAPDMSMSPAVADVGFVHRHLDDREIYFIANTVNQRQTTTARFRVGGLRPQWWNAMSGEVSEVPVETADATSVSVALDLAPYESRVLVFSRATSAQLSGVRAGRKAAATTKPLIDLSDDWRVTFHSSRLSETMPHLRSWTDDDRTRYFSGTATYEKTFSLPASTLNGAYSLMLDFGSGKPVPPAPLKSGMQAWFDPPVREAAVVYVNDQRAGSVWCAPYEIDVTKFISPGENRLRVEVANLALNAMSGQPLPDYRLLNLKYGVRFEAQDMDKVQPIPAGLFGPIKLVTRAR